MPLTMFTAWLFGNLTGTSEFALRAGNFLFGAIALWMMYLIGKRHRLPFLPLLLAIQPFFWFYMDEARPYLAQVAAGSLLTWLVAAVAENQRFQKNWLLYFSLIALAVFTTSMLTAVTIGFAFFACLYLAGVPRLNMRPQPILLLLSTWALSVGLSVYYIWTIIKGAEGSRIWPVDLKSLGYVMYELTGAVGLGPSLDTIRELAKSGALASAISQFAWPIGLSVLLFAVICLGFAACSKARDRNSRLLIVMLGVFVAVAGTMALLSFLIHKPLWARHLSSVFPFLVVGLGMLIQQAWQHGKISKIIVLCFLAATALSSLNIRFSEKFDKDDYRRAAGIARQNATDGKLVWWSAAEYPGRYYGLDIERGKMPDQAKIIVPHYFSQEELTKVGRPDVIITSRPEVYDPSGAVRSFIGTHGFKKSTSLPGFQVFELQTQ